MDWGDASAIAALAVSVAAAGISLRANHHGKRSADASVVSAEASVRSAAVAEEALAEQLREVSERRALAAEAARPRVRLTIVHAGKIKWQLINRGTASAVNVRFVGDYPAIIKSEPDGLTLGPGDLHDFYMAGGMGEPSRP